MRPTYRPTDSCDNTTDAVQRAWAAMAPVDRAALEYSLHRLTSGWNGLGAAGTVELAGKLALLVELARRGRGRR